VTITMTIPTPPGGEPEGVFENDSTTQEIVFDQSNWSAVQTITVAGRDDTIDDGDQTYQISVFPAVSLDPIYADMALPNIFVTNTDNDIGGGTNPGLIVSKSQLRTSEGGGSDSFSISLATQPTKFVTVEVSIQNQAEGRISGNPSNQPFNKSLNFTTFDWNSEKTITIVGLDDSQDDGNIQYSILLAITDDSAEEYKTINLSPIQVTNEDNDVVDPVDSTGGGHTHPGLLWLLGSMALVRYRRPILQTILPA
ncbi:MAG: hypothetical protein PVF82_07480, partial [Gammaproteobacteria bacterium]